MGSDPYRPEEFGPVWETFCTGDFEVVIDSEYALADAAQAQDKMLANDFFGKIVLKP
jgi:NADPH:quinone reductase-like Zn-dependent oxidoreductase